MKIKPPKSYGWILENGNRNFAPWHFESIDSYDAENQKFTKENIENRCILTFAHRQDNDDAAGFEVIDGKATSKVICYHLCYSNKKEDCLIESEHQNLFEFFRKVVFDSYLDWAEIEYGDEIWSPNA